MTQLAIGQAVLALFQSIGSGLTQSGMTIALENGFAHGYVLGCDTREQMQVFQHASLNAQWNCSEGAQV